MTTRDETEEYEEDFYEDEYYDENEYYEDETDTEDLQEDTRVGPIARALASHPHLSMGGGTLAASVIVDLLTRFDPFAVFFGLAAAGYLAVEGPKMAHGVREMFLPGSDTERQREHAMQVADRIAPNSVECSDQRFIAKMARLVGIRKYDTAAQDEEEYELAEPDEEEQQPIRRQPRQLPPLQRVKPNNNAEAGQGLTYERITDLFLTGNIDDARFLALIDHLNNPARTVTRNGRNIATQTASENDGTTQQEATPTGTEDLPPGWTEDKLKMLPGFYIALKNLDKALEAIEVSVSQRNRDFGRNTLKRLGKWKEAQ